MTKENNIFKSADLINLVGVAAGIIISSIGAILFLNAVFNLYLFKDLNPYFYIGEYECSVFDIDRIEAQALTGVGAVPSPIFANTDLKQQKNSKTLNLSEEDKKRLREKYKECKQERARESRERFVIDQKRSLSTGLAFLIVGIPILYFYQRRKNKSL